MTAISEYPAENLRMLETMFGGSCDLITRELEEDGRKAGIALLDGMCDEMKITEAVLKPLAKKKQTDKSFAEEIKDSLYKGTEIGELHSMEEAADAVSGGNLVLFVRGSAKGLQFSVQGYPARAVSEPQTEQNERGSREGFTDNFKDNAALLRRRLRTPALIMERLTKGKTSHTPVLLCYVRGRADEKMLRQVRKKIENAQLDCIFGAGYLRPFLDSGRPSLFCTSGLTERPDTLAAMLSEGRIGIIVDGTPFAVIVPYLLSDYFHTVDDYLASPYYAVFMRALRMLCFLAATALPGLFVAVCLFHPEVLPSDILYEIAAAESKTPFPLMTEALIIHLIYEIVREAGLRMPVAIGHAVSIVGALVIGNAAVTAGLIAAPMLIIVALTTVSSSVISQLHEPVAMIRFALILVGGLTGFPGIVIGCAVILTDICSHSQFGVPFTAPLSPFSPSAQRDTLFRQDWKKLGGKAARIGEMRY